MKTGEKVKARKNHIIFTYQGKNYKYDDIYNLIKDIEYRKSNVCDWQIIDVNDGKTGKRAICVIFQETCGKLDWLHDFAFLPVPKYAYKGHENDLLYHGGFYTEYQCARDSIIHEIALKIADIHCFEETPFEEIPIYITGWSLGGSIAPICAEDIYYQFNIKPTLICYEGANPCFGFHTVNHVLKCVTDDSICFVNGYDIVPRVPPFFIGFMKLKPFVYYMKESKKLPFLFPVIRHIIWFIKDTRRTHRNVDEAIQSHMEEE